MIQIRRATESDIPWLLTQLKAFDKFFAASRNLFPDDEHATNFLKALMAPDAGCFFVAEGKDGLLGFIAGILTPHAYNPSIRVLNELFWWVAREWRGTSAGSRLLAAFTEFGQNNADWVVMTLETRSPIDPRSLERRGFKAYETNYLWEPQRPSAVGMDLARAIGTPCE